MAFKAGTVGAIPSPPVTAGHLGQGIAYPLTCTSEGRLKLSWGAQSVADAVHSICRTQPGERVMLPDYGGDRATFDVLNPERTIAQVRQAILDYEPRIRRCDPTARPGENMGELIVEVPYYIHGEATSRTLTESYWTPPATTLADGSTG